MKNFLRLFRFLIPIVALLIAANIDAKPRRKTVVLYLGLTEEIKVSNMPSNLGDDLNYNRNIAKISLAKELKLMRIEPLQAGETNFAIKNDKGVTIADYRIIVRKSNLNRAASEIKSLLGDIEGIAIKIVNGKIVVDGEILLPRDMSRIYTVIAQFSDVASSIVTMSPLAQQKIARLIEQDIGNPEIHVRAVNEKFILEGTAASEAEKAKSEILAKTYVPDVVVEKAEADGVVKKRKIDSVINLLNVKAAPEPQPGKIIKLVVHYVELQKDYAKGFRFQWTPTLKEDSGINFSSGGQSNGGVVGAITGTISDLLPKLNFAKTHGHARILQSSSIIVQDGNPGVIKSVTRIPYSAQNQYGQIVTNFAESGLDTTITPSIVSAKSNSINLTIQFSLKSLIGQTEKGPLISDRSIQTKLVIMDTQSAAIGGLVSNDQSMAYNRLPAGASQNPIVSLYASKQFQKNQSQFVVFVTPVIMSSASEGSDDIKKKFRLRE